VDKSKTFRLELIPFSRLIDLFFLTESLFQVNLKAVGQVQEIAQHIGELLFEFQLLLSGLLLV